MLFGAYGEQLQKKIPEEQNELSLDGFAAGFYAPRMEAGKEVM